MIADFEEGALGDVTGNGLGLSGYCYPVTSVGSSATTALATTGVSGCAAGSYASIGGTIGSASPVYVSLQGDFTNPKGAYSVPGSYNAFVFCIKSSTLTQVWFSVSDAATTASSDNAGVYVPISSSWQSVTVCFNHMQSQGWGLPGHMFDPTKAISYSWESTASGIPYDIEVDNFQFATVAGASCPSFTPTPTPNYVLIDDFETTGGAPSDSVSQIYTIADQNGHWRDGAVFSYASTLDGSSVTVTANAGGGTPGTAMEVAGTMVAASSYAAAGFNFTNSATGAPHNAGVSFYDGTVGSLYSGIRFDMKANSMSATNCTGVQPVVVDLIDSTLADHQIAVPVTAAYQPYTIFYNQCLSSTGTALNQNQLYQMTFKVLNNGNTNYSYDLLVDNIAFTNAAAPPPATPLANSVIDNFQGGSNQIQFPYAVSLGDTPGYWFDYTEQYDAPGMCPEYTYYPPPTTGPEAGFFMGTTGPANVVPGVPSFAASLYDSSVTFGPPGYLGYGGMGFAFNKAGALDLSGGGSWTHLVFYVKSTRSTQYIVALSDTNTNGDGCYGPSINFYPYNTSFSSATASPSWTPVTISFISTAGDYNLGLPSIVKGTNGCGVTVNGGNPYAFGYNIAQQIEWQVQGGTPQAVDLEVGDIYLY